jgi:hypothetical protein
MSRDQLTQIKREIEVNLVDTASDDLVSSNKSKEITQSPNRFLDIVCSDRGGRDGRNRYSRRVHAIKLSIIRTVLNYDSATGVSSRPTEGTHFVNDILRCFASK